MLITRVQLNFRGVSRGRVQLQHILPPILHGGNGVTQATYHYSIVAFPAIVLLKDGRSVASIGCVDPSMALESSSGIVMIVAAIVFCYNCLMLFAIAVKKAFACSV